DLNKDGDPDLVIGSGQGVMVFHGSAGATFQKSSDRLPGTEFPASSVVTSDFDSDGIADIAVSCRVLSCITILKGEGNNSFVPAVTVDVPAGEFIRTGDIDGDGQADLIGSGGALWVALSSREPGAAPPWDGVPIRPPQPKILINEILASNNRYRFPGAGEHTADAVEIFNGQKEPVQLDGWTLRRIQTFPNGEREIKESQIWNGVAIEAGGRMVVQCRKSFQGYESGAYVDFKLPASGATVELLDLEDAVIDSVAYPPLELNHSFARYQDGIESFRHNMLPDIGEPNVDNGALEPTVYFDGFTADRLEAGQPIRLTARANDDVGVIGLTVIYKRVDDPFAPIEKMLLFDDGEHDDGGMLDGVFAGELPAMPAGGEIQFFIEAVDLNNQIVTLPGDPVFVPTQETGTNLLNRIYSLSVGNPLEQLRISEVVTDNESHWKEFLVGETQEPRWLSPDYLELRNTGNVPLQLEGLAIGQSFFDSEEDLFHFSPGDSIAPGENRIIYFSDYDLGPGHVRFPLRKNGDEVFVMGEGEYGSRALIDVVRTGVLDDDEALFRLGDTDEWRQGPSTPGESNWTGRDSIVRLDDGRVGLVLPSRRGESLIILRSESLRPGTWEPFHQLDGSGYEEFIPLDSDGPAAYFRVATE
ncbi:MAG: lamin tail domain-containing protein, partial [Verrucomicrobiota bacterium]